MPRSTGRPAPPRGPSTRAAARAIDPRLILQPRTLTRAATAGGLRLTLTVAPLIPGANRFELRLGGARPLDGAARVQMAAVMTAMAMAPIRLSLRAARRGIYEGVGPLTMFGRWQLTVQIDRPGAAPLIHRFMVAVDLPGGLLRPSP